MNDTHHDETNPATSEPTPAPASGPASAEAAFTAYRADPTPGLGDAAAAAITRLQQAHDDLLHLLDEARRYARVLHQGTTYGMLDWPDFDLNRDPDTWPTWLTYYDATHPADQRPR